jgi:hypothetical protein
MIHTSVEVLGTEYDVQVGKRKELPITKGNMGECRVYGKEIYCVHNREDNCSKQERDERTSEIVAHEMFHAFANEAGLDLDDDTEERVAIFYMKVWRKMNNAILQVLDDNQLLE